MVTSKPSKGDMNEVAGHTLWNLFGMITPLFVALFAIPILIKHLGDARFGALGIIGLLIGYLSVFDLGIGQAQAYLIADCRGRNREDTIPALFQTSLWVILILSGILGTGLALASSSIVSTYLEMPPELEGEVRLALLYAAGAIPFAILAPCLIATLEAYQEFKLINLIRIPTSASYLLAPLAVIPFTDTLPPVILAMIAGRVLETSAFLYLCLRKIPGTFNGFHFSKDLCLRLLSYGGWMTVTNILLPLMIHGDRFILGYMSLALVTIYITPAELIVRLLVLPRALVTVLFPNITIRFASDTAGLPEMISQSIRLLLGAMTLGCSILITFGPFALKFWLGEEYHPQSSLILQWLALGITFLSLAYIPRFLIQASGKPRITALMCLCEVPIYIFLATNGVIRGGATGIAMAWCIRCLIHMVALFALSTPRLPGFAPEWKGLIPRLGIGLLILFGLVILPTPDSFPAHLIPIPFATGLIVWFLLFTSSERSLLLTPVKHLLQKNGRSDT